MGYYWGSFPPARPRDVQGGIRAQSQRGAFGTSWWAHRWMEVLERFHLGARLGRGRAYARRGQVREIQIGKGTVAAVVQGSSATPYLVTIEVAPLASTDWAKLVQVFTSQAIFAAKLLAGEMPPSIEDAFTAEGLALFPAGPADLATDCSCPDWSNPCKHIAAVYFLLAEEFDRDPFMLFTLRGMSREELVERISKAAAGSVGLQARMAASQGAAEPSAQTRPPEPLPAEAAAFWQGVEVPDDLDGAVDTPRRAATLPKRLGRFPFWRGREPFLPALEPIYAAAASVGLETYLRTQDEAATRGAPDEDAGESARLDHA
ncbi:MAG: hypothetical protein CL878_03555 [Dehalococcoidia bacterium]|nr:hypothetical protein [Dehalococcoidia bacterium]